MGRNLFRVHLLITAVLVVIQSTLFRFIEVRGASPDLVLIYLVFAAHTRGAMQGQILGFAAGVVEDLLSLAPLGFNSLIRLITGFLFGQTRGKIFLDPIISPILFVAAATFLKELLALFLSLIFKGNPMTAFSLPFWLTLGMNVLIAPAIYNLFRMLKVFIENDRDSR